MGLDFMRVSLAIIAAGGTPKINKWPAAATLSRRLSPRRWCVPICPGFASRKKLLHKNIRLFNPLRRVVV
ncbi:hypothetical protein LTSEUGA_1554 [Salmonella enterica subsp. enterica serovar Uganda str. R8-3404]|uniref:Uncharacterized protein n=1 Tax=Salmonella enterica subsp. enterica serovar Uganda str. R8-3404 TaxID=913083 RepID=A0A6C8H445_SALET|nr:hypothetical protein LTSEUGA_1554 [Salmonella enterica subsp. enterica serovar Uganda str. R8-3404]